MRAPAGYPAVEILTPQLYTYIHNSQHTLDKTARRSQVERRAAPTQHHPRGALFDHSRGVIGAVVICYVRGRYIQYHIDSSGVLLVIYICIRPENDLHDDARLIASLSRRSSPRLFLTLRSRELCPESEPSSTSQVAFSCNV